MEPGRKTTLFREVNDTIDGLLRRFDAGAVEADFLCECSLAECSRRVALRRSEYEAARRLGGFVVAPLCVRGAETLERTERYAVVVDVAAGSGTAVNRCTPASRARAGASISA